MRDPVEHIQALAAEAKARAEANRQAFPAAAEMMDKLRVFNPRLLYAREGGREIGIPLEQRLARRSDPVSSHEAAAEHVASGSHDSQKADVLRTLRAHPRSTSAELSAYGIDRFTVARRLPDLEKEGFVRRDGLRDCRVTKRRSVVWVAL